MSIHVCSSTKKYKAVNQLKKSENSTQSKKKKVSRLKIYYCSFTWSYFSVNSPHSPKYKFKRNKKVLPVTSKEFFSVRPRLFQITKLKLKHKTCNKVLQFHFACSIFLCLYQSRNQNTAFLFLHLSLCSSFCITRMSKGWIILSKIQMPYE